MAAEAAGLLLLGLLACVGAQSNYAAQANDVEYAGNGLPEQTVLDGKVTKLDELSPVIFLNRTKAALNCAAGSMQVELKFNEEFFGIAYADFDRNSACQIAGRGALGYRLELPLKGCGTRQEPLRVFTNNIVVRFHPGLEMDGDEVITIVCRYPPPIAPAPPLLLPRVVGPAPVAPIEPPLRGIQILLIICAILFLTLLLLGLGVSYLCLRRRTLPPHYRLPYSRSGSEITKLSGSSLGNLSAFEGVKIPRVPLPPPCSSGSEGLPPSSDTLPSDYPSESHSEGEEEIVHSRSPPPSSERAYASDGAHGEGFADSGETQSVSAAAVARSTLAAERSAPPAFDVQVRVRRAPPSPPDRMSDSTSVRSDRNLSTIEEQREEMPPPPPPPPPQPQGPPRRIVQQPPLYSRIVRKTAQEWDSSDGAAARRPRSIASLDTEMTDTHSITELVDDSHGKLFSVKRPAPLPPVRTAREEEAYAESLEPAPETPILPARKPEITAHMVDDVFLRTITEKKTVEDVERHRRLVTEYKSAPRPVPARWDVTIRNYPPPGDGNWEDFSDVSSASGMTIASRSEPPFVSQQSYIESAGPHLFSPELVGNVGSGSLPLLPELPPARNPLYAEDEVALSPLGVAEPVPVNWDVLVRVLRPEAVEEMEFEEREALTTEERTRWRQIISSRSELRRALSECAVREDFQRVSEDRRYGPLFPQHKWDVIIRTLAPPQDRPKGGRYRKKSDWDTRSRRSSLPTLYEYDSDGGASGRTPRPPAASPSRRTSRSSYRSDHVDMRSMSEMMVDYARMDGNDSQSEASLGMPLSTRFYDTDSDGEQDFRIPRTSSQRSIQRSLSQPSLVRSASEFTERWAADDDRDDADASDDEETPRPVRRNAPGQGQRRHMATFTSSEVRTFQATEGWPK